jgi:hypothetical protein
VSALRGGALGAGGTVWQPDKMTRLKNKTQKKRMMIEQREGAEEPLNKTRE